MAQMAIRNMRAIFVHVAIAALVCHLARAQDCPDPDLTGKDLHGVDKVAALRKRGLFYEDRVFESMERSAESTRKVARAVLKAPIHTCRIKQTPGLREWITSKVETYGGRVEVQPFSQPPNLNLFAENGEFLERVKVLEEATVEDVMGFLRSRGLRPDGEPEHLDLPAKDSAGCSAPDPNADTDADAEPGLPAASFESPADAQARVAREAAETVSAALKAEIEQFRRMHGEDVPLPPTLAGGSSGGSTMSQPPSTTQSAEDVENDVVAELLREQQFEIRSISVDGTVLRTQDS